MPKVVNITKHITLWFLIAAIITSLSYVLYNGTLALPSLLTIYRVAFMSAICFGVVLLVQSLSKGGNLVISSIFGIVISLLFFSFIL